MIERFEKDGKNYLIGYHTQECRYESELSEPIAGEPKEAWLGDGYYFWAELEFAHYWGIDVKRKTARTGLYDIYRAYLDVENCLNTVFNEDQYFFFKGALEKATEHCKSIGVPISHQQVNRFLFDNFWSKTDVTGIIFEDIPTNKTRIHSEIQGFYYKKRIQIVLFNLANIFNFGLFLYEQ